jgi:RNA polymerase sigma-70 factor (ECF subfamily)
MTVEQLSFNDFERLVRQVGPAMLAYARRRTDPHTAEDVVAEALAVLWRRRPEVPTTGISEESYDATAWAVGITRKCLANAQRSARRHVTLMGRVATMADRPTSDRDYIDSDRNEPLHKALGSLRPPDRELLRLWAWDDLKPAQIAAVLETSPENVSVRLHRAKQRLAAALKSLDDDGTRGSRNALPSGPQRP